MSKESKHTRKEILEVSGIGDVVSQLRQLNAASKVDKMQEMELAKNAPGLLAATEGMSNVQSAFVDSSEDFRRRFLAGRAGTLFDKKLKDKPANHETQKSILGVLTDQFEWWKGLMKERGFDDVESAREGDVLALDHKKDIVIDQNDSGIGAGMLALYALKLAIIPIAAGIAAVTAGLMGFRGWEGTILKSIAKAGKSLTNMFKPLASISAGISTWAKNSKVFIWLKSYGGKIGGIFKKIFKPIGFLFSIFEGVQAFMGTEGSLYEKFSAGISAAIGDFFGSFFDLVKDGISWLLGSLGFDDAAKWLDGFSFEDIFTNLLEGIFGFVGDIVAWIGDFFTNPIDTIAKLWNGNGDEYEPKEKTFGVKKAREGVKEKKATEWLLDDELLEKAREQLNIRQEEIKRKGPNRNGTTNNVGAMNSGNNSNNQVINTTVNGGVNEAFGNLATSLST